MRKASLSLCYLFGVFTAMLASAEEIPVVIEGHEIQGGHIIGQTSPEIEVTYNGQKVRKTQSGFFFIGFNRDDKSSQNIKFNAPDGREKTIQLTIKKRDYDVQHIDGLPPKKVTPDPEHVARIQRESRLAQAARKHDKPIENFLEHFQWPVMGPITGVYGSQRVLNGKPRRPHFGVDVAAPTGTPVFAPAGGVVTLVHDDMYFSGGTLILDHGHGVSSTFIHLNKVLAKEGQQIKQGDLIAEVGATGRVTGAHLDWRMNWFKQRLDPTFFVGPMPTD